VKKEAGEVVEMSGWRNVINPQSTKEFQKLPRSHKISPNMGAQIFLNFQNFQFFNFLKKINILWHGASVVIGKDAFSEILHSSVNVFMSAS
jgi:hypothetical protein